MRHLEEFCEFNYESILNVTKHKGFSWNFHIAIHSNRLGTDCAQSVTKIVLSFSPSMCSCIKLEQYRLTIKFTTISPTITTSIEQNFEILVTEKRFIRTSDVVPKLETILPNRLQQQNAFNLIKCQNNLTTFTWRILEIE